MMPIQVTTPYHSIDARVHLTDDEHMTLCGLAVPAIRWWGEGSRGQDGEVIRDVWFKRRHAYGPRCPVCHTRYPDA